MKRYGNPRLKTAGVDSNQFHSGQSFNKLVVNNLSEVDQGSLDHDVIIFNKDDDQIYTYAAEHDSWVALSERSNIHPRYDTQYLPELFIDTSMDVYNEVNLAGNGTDYLYIDPDLFNFGETGSPIDFVIDFWIATEVRSHVDECYGTIAYNGLDIGQVDLEVNKNLVITTGDVSLLKDPVYQKDPIIDYSQYSNRDNYIHIPRPGLVSARPLPLIDGLITHVAVIRSGETTYLAINGHIEDSAPSVEYYHYDNVKLGAGFVGALSGKLINFRVSKNTDRGWTEDFTPPNENPAVDGNTDFLMGEATLIDSAGNYTINVEGSAPTVTQNRFPYDLSLGEINRTIKTNLSQDKLVLRLPDIDMEYSYVIDCDIPVEVHTYREHLWGNIPANYNSRTIIDVDSNEHVYFTVTEFTKNLHTILHTNNFRFFNNYILYRYFYYRPLNIGGTVHYQWMNLNGAVYSVHNNLRNYSSLFPLDGPPLIPGCGGSTNFENVTTSIDYATDVLLWDRNYETDFIIELHGTPGTLTKLFGENHADTLTTRAYSLNLFVDTDLYLKGRSYFYPNQHDTYNPIFSLWKLEVGVTYHIIIARSRVSNRLYILLKDMDASVYNIFDGMNIYTNTSYDHIEHRLFEGPWYISHVRAFYDFDDSALTETNQDHFSLFRHNPGFTEFNYINMHYVFRWQDYDRLYSLKSYEGSKFINVNYTFDDFHIGTTGVNGHYSYNHSQYLVEKQGPADDITHVFDGNVIGVGTGIYMMSTTWWDMRNYSWAIDFWINLKLHDSSYRYIFGNNDNNYNYIRYNPNNDLIYFDNASMGALYAPTSFNLNEWYHVIIGRNSNSTISIIIRSEHDDDYATSSANLGTTVYDQNRIQLFGGPWYLSNFRFWRKPGAITDTAFDFMKFPKGYPQSRMINYTIGQDNEALW